MEKNFTIRRARIGDMAAVSALWSETARQHQAYDAQLWCWADDAATEWQKRFRDLLRNPETIVLVATMAGGAVVAFSIATCKENPPIFTVKRTGEIWDLCVLPEHRRKGIAVALMEAAFDELRGLEAKDVRLHVAIENQAAVGLYEKLGMKPLMYRMYKRL
jgi:ribosomal protein S18 acetylase RimI-like enzyme